MKTVVNRIDLGFTRIAGYTLYDDVSHEFQETTPKEVKNLIIHGQVNGLKLVNDEIELDKESFYMTNLMIKSAVGKFRALFLTSSMINCMYSVIRIIETDKGRLYETVSNKCARVKITSDKLNMLMQIGYVAGVRKLENGEIEISKGVVIEDRRTKVNKTEEKVQPVSVEAKQSLSDINTKEKMTKSENTESLETLFKSMDVPDIKDSTSANENEQNKKSANARKTKQK